MEPKVIRKLFEMLRTSEQEITTLYELTESDKIILMHILMELPIGGISPKLAARLLRAAAHYLESIDEVASSVVKEEKKER